MVLQNLGATTKIVGGGVPIKIRSKSSRPAKGEKNTVANPAKFKDIDIENGRVRRW